MMRRVSLHIFILCLAGCNLLPSLENRSASVAFTDTGNTRLGKAVAPRIAANPGYSGVYPLADPLDSFAARMRLVETAERSLDLQYYIWNKDMTGVLLFDAVHRSAERGVRVRMLLDDNNTGGLDPILAPLDAHPNIEIRLFNPFVMRGTRLFKYIFDFPRANRRMHNKSFTADNQVTVVGGLNVGDEYFGAGSSVLFADLDVMAIGPVVRAVSHDFDRYWASASSYPAARLIPLADSNTAAEFAATVSRVQHDPATGLYTKAVRDSAFVRDLVEGRLTLDWAATRLISDDPAKGLGLAAPEALLTYKLKDVIGEPTRELNLVSPYFVPTATGVASLTALAKEGIHVRVLTNSLEATDVALVHSGYAKWRKPLIEGGVRLYESPQLSPRVREPTFDGRRTSGSSDSSLHAKTFSVDQSRVFVGSFNFDPRSARLNTEMGLVIESSELARKISKGFNRAIPASAYELGLTDSGELYWVQHLQGQRVRHDVEPGTTFWQRAAVRIISLLPIDWLL
jgi:cardiolipin synthase C